MKKRLFILGMVVALVAALAVPMAVSAANTSIVSGTMTATDGSITVSVAPITLNALNRGAWSTGNFTTGSVTLVAPINGGRPVASWIVSAAADHAKMQAAGPVSLTDQLLIRPNGTTTWSGADGLADQSSNSGVVGPIPSSRQSSVVHTLLLAPLRVPSLAMLRSMSRMPIWRVFTARP